MPKLKGKKKTAEEAFVDRFMSLSAGIDLAWVMQYLQGLPSTPPVFILLLKIEDCQTASQPACR